jgi:hypothetical protein
MPDVSVTPFEIEATTRYGDVVRAAVYLPKDAAGPFPTLLGASPYQKMLRYLPVVPSVFIFIEYGPSSQTGNPGLAINWAKRRRE